MFREWKTSCSKKKNNRHLRERRFVSGTQPKCKLATVTNWDEDEDGGHNSDGGTNVGLFGSQQQPQPQPQPQPQRHQTRPTLMGKKQKSTQLLQHIGSLPAEDERGVCHFLSQLLRRLFNGEHQQRQQHPSFHCYPPLPYSTAPSAPAAINSLLMMSTSLHHFCSPFAKTISKASVTLLPLLCSLLLFLSLLLSLPSPATCQHQQPPPSSPRQQQERSAALSGSKQTLYIAGFFPTSRDKVEGATGRGVLPAVKLALQHVNESPLFTKYRLDLVWNDTKCDAGYGMKAFFGMLDEEPVKIILFGDACSVVTDPIAKAIKFFHLIQLSYADTFTATTANFFRIVPSEESFNPARVKLLQHFNWKHVGTIYQNTPRNSLPHSKLLAQLDHAEITILESQSIASELAPKYYFEKFKEKDVRIILGNFNETWAKRIFCQAFKDNMFGRRYQWIITGIYENNWWELSEDEAEELGCSTEQLLLAIDGYISTDVLPVVKNASTYYGFETSLYKSEYDRVRLKEYSRFHGYAYDGIWAIALAIQTVDKKLRMRNSHRTIEDFHYRDPFWAQLFREALNETDFDGVTGHVSFDKNERRGIVLLQRFQRKTRTSRDIAQYITATDELQFVANIDWGGAKAPVDRVIERIVPSRISMTLFIVISVFAIIGIAIAFVFLAMNIKYRNQRYIKMSSPYLNNLIIIGCILTYTSVILLGLNSGLTSESNFPYICASRAWVLMTGFTLAFGSMFSKTWRVHAIFTDIKLNKKLIKDYKLFMVVGILVFIDVATLTTWQIVDPFYREVSKGAAEVSPLNEDLQIVPEMEYCTSKKMHIFLGSIYMYKGVLMAIGIFLAWETRQVSIPALNDSKYIGMSVYNVVIMCVIGAGLSYVLRDQQDAAFVIISIFIIFCSTATLCLVFVPKLIELKRNPNAGDRRVRATLKPFKKSHHDSDEIEIHTKIKLVTEDNFRFRQRLKEKSYELEALTFRLRALEESAKLFSSKSNEIVVEENDLKQLDNCDQRKLSVASVKQAVATKRRKSSNSVRQLIGKIEMAEESSTEIIVNSTSILELSSEAAQLTVKNGSVDSDGGDSVRGGGAERDSKSSDEMSITYRNMDMLNSTTSSSSHHHHHHSHSHSHTHHPQSHHHHHQYANNIITVKANGNKNSGDDSGGDQNSEELDSDDTSYAKAISQTIVSEVVVVPVVVEGASNLHHHHGQPLPLHSSFHCHSHSHSHRALHVATPCCHHHLPEHHHHHHPHHVQHEQPQPLPPPPPPIGPLHYSHHLSNATVPGSSTTTSASVGTGGTGSGSGSSAGYGGGSITGSTLPMAVVKSRADQMASEVLQSALVAQHIQSREGTEKSRRRRTQSFGGFLSNDNTSDGGGSASGMPFQLLMPPSEFSGTFSAGGDGGSPVRTCSSVDDTLNVESAGVSNAGGVTSASSYIRLFPYLNRSASIDQPQQSQALRRSGGQSCPSVDVRCDIVEYL